MAVFQVPKYKSIPKYEGKKENTIAKRGEKANAQPSQFPSPFKKGEKENQNQD